MNKSVINHLDIKKISILGVSFLFILPLFVAIYAQTSLPLTVSPVRNEIELSPGESTTVNVKFYNGGESPVVGIIGSADFIVDNKSGTPVLVEDYTQNSSKFSGNAWIRLPYSRLSLPVKDQVTVPVRIEVPANALPGGRYVAVYMEPNSGEVQTLGQPKEAGVAISSRIVSLLYLKVSGEIMEQAMVSRFFSPSFYENGPINLVAEINNQGDYHIRPRGVITLSNMFGGLVDQISLEENNIFPESILQYEKQIGHKWMIGKYQIDFAGSYGDQGKGLTRSISVWVFPWKVATIIVLSLVLIVVLLRQVYTHIKTRQMTLEQIVSKEQAEIEQLKKELRRRESK